MSDDPLPLEFRLVKAGYGDLSQVRGMTAREFLQALYFEKYLGDYESSYFTLNRREE